MLLEKVVQCETFLPAHFMHQLSIIFHLISQVRRLLTLCFETLVEPAADDVQEQLIRQYFVVNNWNFLV